MLNMIKMDVYRMFRTKSMYVIWIILLASALLTSFLSKIDYDAVNKEWEKQQWKAIRNSFRSRMQIMSILV